MPIQFDNFVSKPPCIGSDWPPANDDWKANNNTLGDWDKCFNSTSEIPQHLAASFGNTSLTIISAKQPGMEDKILPDAGYSSPKEDGRKSSEHTNSYDVSASQSPNTDGAQSDSTADEPIDVEIMTQTEEMEVDAKDETIKAEAVEETIEVKTPVPTLPAPIAIAPLPIGNQRLQTLEDILALPQHRFQEVIAEAENRRKGTVPEAITSLFMRSGSSAFSNIEPKEVAQSASASNGSEPPAPTVIVAPNSSLSSSASFCRPPGLGPVNIPPAQNGQNQLVCPICGFTCPSKFHFNSHMNTHGDHQCSMCDYTSRTEGRLKKHMQQSHTIEEQLRVGLELEPAKEASGSSSSPKSTATSKDSSATSPVSETFNLSTTMASLLDSTNSAIAAISTTDLPPALATTLKLDISSTPNLLSSLNANNITSSALDQIKAFAENTNLLPENGISLATALGAVSQVAKGEPGSPDKATNSEPRRSSNGKVKKHKCKQCQHISTTKNDQWSHARTHIPVEKQLNCQQCNFVTEYKHHLEYHYRNHIGSKPFKCVKCGYSCVNKSMLNSHMKSHTNHYQFRCVDCTYATKYCHSLKLHLKKYNHRRVPEGMDMTGGDISPSLSTTDSNIPSSPTQIKQEIKTEPSEPSTPIAQPFAFNPMVNGQGLNFANQMLLNNNGLMGISGLRSGVSSPFKCTVCDFVCSSQDEQMRHSMSHILSSTTVPTTLASLYNTLNLPHFANVKIEKEDDEEEDDGMEVEIKVEDDTTESQHSGEEMDHSSDLASSPTGSSQASSADEETKKCKSLTMEQFSQRLRGSSPMSNDSAVVKDEESADETQHSPSDTISAASPPQNPIVLAAPIPLAPQADSLFQVFLQQATASMAMSLASRNQQLSTQPMFPAHLAPHLSSFETQYKCPGCQFSSSDQLTVTLHSISCLAPHR